MTTLTFENLKFTKDNAGNVHVDFLKLFYFTLTKKHLEHIGPYTVKEHSITFKTDDSKEQVRHQFNNLLGSGFQHLANSLNENPVTYVHKYSGIPLFGSLFFGIVDKGSSMLEVKPITGCNLNCTFCSVDEGPSSKKQRDFVVEKDYLIEELQKLMEYKLTKNSETEINVYLNPHGEPTLYADLVPLIAGIRKIKGIKDIIIITNGLLLTKNLIDKLKEAGLSGINLSLHSLNKEKAASLFGVKALPLQKLLDNIVYASRFFKIFISPVLLQNTNEEDMEDIIKFCKKHKLTIGIQNLLFNKQGRNPVKPLPWKKFDGLLQGWEKEFDVSLLYNEKKTKTIKTPTYSSPLKKDQTISATMVSRGRYQKDIIAVAENRSIYVASPKRQHSIGSKINIKITRSLHNVFFGIEY